MCPNVPQEVPLFSAKLSARLLLPAKLDFAPLPAFRNAAACIYCCCHVKFEVWELSLPASTGLLLRFSKSSCSLVE